MEHRGSFLRDSKLRTNAGFFVVVAGLSMLLLSFLAKGNPELGLTATGALRVRWAGVLIVNLAMAAQVFVPSLAGTLLLKGSTSFVERYAYQISFWGLVVSLVALLPVSAVVRRRRKARSEGTPLMNLGPGGDGI